MEAQGYNHGNRELWLPKPEFISYKVPSKKAIPRGGQPRKRVSSKIYKDWIVPHNLSSAQGYYDGPTQLWVPKDANHSQGGSSSLHEIRRPKHSNQIIQQRPVKSNASISNNKVSSSQLQPQKQRWMPKKTQGTHDKQEALVKQEQAWVPKKLETTRELQTSSRSSINGKQWVPIQCSIHTKPKEKIPRAKEKEVPLQELSSAFFMTINPIYDPSPIQDMDQLVEEILCQWGMQ